jgi:threonine/homoserine/homoserine lactone efflux protein
VLGDAIGDLLPSALAVALTPIPIVAIVLVLGTSNARTAGPAFVFGWIAGLVFVSVVVVLLVAIENDADSDDPGLDWLKIAIGVLFLVMAARQWTKRPAHDEELATPDWMTSLEGATPRKALLLGATFSGANPKNLALTAAASASIAEAGLDRIDTAIAIVVFIALASVTVAGPMLFYLLDAERAAGPLAAVKQFMSDNDVVIKMVVLLLLGAVILGDGLGDVWR